MWNIKTVISSSSSCYDELSGNIYNNQASFDRQCNKCECENGVITCTKVFTNHKLN